MTKRAAIYARVSSERQAAVDRVSIEVQLADCEAYCKELGYVVVARYVDKEKYRVKGKLVQPSAQRKDRPKYLAMLKAAKNGEFDIVVAWKEDRLYRGMYAAMPFSEVLDEMGKYLDVELVRETFDRKMLGIKAALGKIEVDNIRERMMMGRRARLEKGEVPGGDQVRYGYCKVDKRLEVDEAEVKIIHKIIDLYLAGNNGIQIRRKLIAGGTPTRKGGLWSKATIERILTCESYVTGKIKTNLDGETFYIDCPPIISRTTWQKIQEVRQRNKHESRNRKEDFLCAGLVYCACSWKCQAKAKASNRHRGYDAVQGLYICQRRGSTPENLPPTCAMTTGSQKVDNFVWDFIKRLCRNPAVLREAVTQKLIWLEAEQNDVEAEAEKLHKQLDELLLERQRVITMARKDIITEDDLALQLTSLQFHEIGLRKEMEEKQAIAAAKSQAQDLSDWAARYLSEIRTGVEGLDVDLQLLTTEQRQALIDEFEAWQYADKFPGDELAQLRWAIFEEKRRTVRTLVDRVIVTRTEGPEKRKITVVLALDMPDEFLAYGDQSPDYKPPDPDGQILTPEEAGHD